MPYLDNRHGSLHDKWEPLIDFPGPKSLLQHFYDPFNILLSNSRAFSSDMEILQGSNITVPWIVTTHVGPLSSMVKCPFYHALPHTSMESMFWKILPIKQNYKNTPLFLIFKINIGHRKCPVQHRATSITTVNWYNPHQKPVRVMQSPVARSRAPGLEYQLSHLPAVWLWEN